MKVISLLNGLADKKNCDVYVTGSIKDSFKKIVITSNTPKPFYTDEGILMNIFAFSIYMKKWENFSKTCNYGFILV